MTVPPTDFRHVQYVRRRLTLSLDPNIDDDGDDYDDDDDDDENIDRNLVREKQFDAVAKTFLCRNVQRCLTLPFSIIIMIMIMMIWWCSNSVDNEDHCDDNENAKPTQILKYPLPYIEHFW